jgi:hypothetical protein
MIPGMRALVVTIAICGAGAAWSQDEPKAAIPIFREAPGALQCELLRRMTPEAPAQASKECEAPCATWARSQDDYRFSYEVCVTKYCGEKDVPGCF